MSDRKVTLNVQKNGSINKIVSKSKSLGELGELDHRVRWNRFGEARVLDAEIVVTSPICGDLMAAVGEIEGEA